jgi:hypothetical protein
MDLGTRGKFSNRISFEIISFREVNLNSRENNIQLYDRDTGAKTLTRLNLAQEHGTDHSDSECSEFLGQ